MVGNDGTENLKHVRIVNVAITGLCESCDPDCKPRGVRRADGTTPHCYVNSDKRVRLLRAVRTATREVAGAEKLEFGQWYDGLKPRQR